jgi:hypothetical protein
MATALAAAACSCSSPGSAAEATTYRFELTIQVDTDSQPSGVGKYVYLAGLAVQVNSLQPDPVQCSYGTPVATPTGSHRPLSTCLTGPLAGQDLARTPTVTNSTDSITVAMTLDNAENVNPDSAGSSLAACLRAAGNLAQTARAAMTVLLPPPYDGIGTLTSFIGKGLVAAGSVTGLPSNGKPSSTCNGGLVKDPPGAGQPPLDYLYETFTASQLRTLTANGPITLSYPVGTDYSTTGGACWSEQVLQLKISRTRSTNGGPASFADSAIAYEFLPPGGSWTLWHDSTSGHDLP